MTDVHGSVPAPETLVRKAGRWLVAMGIVIVGIGVLAMIEPVESSGS